MQSQPGKHSSVFDALDSFISTRIAPVEEDKAGGNESDEEILMLDSAGPGAHIWNNRKLMSTDRV